MQKNIQEILRDSINVKQAILSNSRIIDTIAEIVNVCILALKGGNKVLFCGNGGSAADAQHLAAELSGRFYLDRAPYFAEALHVNSSFVTAVANDFGYEEIFERAVQAKGRVGDVLFCLTTSGSSKNVVKAAIQAKKQGVIVVGLTGAKVGSLNEFVDYLIAIPSLDTPRIQEGHITVGHIICALIEQKMAIV